MLRLLGIVISIGLADSLNPTTIAPALYLASGERPRHNVTRFTLGVFAVYLIGGAVIALGPGQLLLSLIPTPGRFARQWIEVAAGGVMIGAAALLWRHRRALGDRAAPEFEPRGRSSVILGATIMAVELPTAFPYFAAIAAIVGSGLGPARQLVLLLVFNVCFVLPLVGIVATLHLGGPGAEERLARVRLFMHRHWPIVFASVALIAGTIVIVLGLSGLAHRHSHLGRLLRHIGHFLPEPLR